MQASESKTSESSNNNIGIITLLSQINGEYQNKFMIAQMSGSDKSNDLYRIIRSVEEAIKLFVDSFTCTDFSNFKFENNEPDFETLFCILDEKLEQLNMGLEDNIDQEGKEALQLEINNITRDYNMIKDNFGNTEEEPKDYSVIINYIKFVSKDILENIAIRAMYGKLENINELFSNIKGMINILGIFVKDKDEPDFNQYSDIPGVDLNVGPKFDIFFEAINNEIARMERELKSLEISSRRNENKINEYSMKLEKLKEALPLIHEGIVEFNAKNLDFHFVTELLNSSIIEASQHYSRSLRENDGHLATHNNSIKTLEDIMSIFTDDYDKRIIIEYSQEEYYPDYSSFVHKLKELSESVNNSIIIKEELKDGLIFYNRGSCKESNDLQKEIDELRLTLKQYTDAIKVICKKFNITNEDDEEEKKEESDTLTDEIYNEIAYMLDDCLSFQIKIKTRYKKSYNNCYDNAIKLIEGKRVSLDGIQNREEYFSEPIRNIRSSIGPLSREFDFFNRVLEIVDERNDNDSYESDRLRKKLDLIRTKIDTHESAINVLIG